jgi:hypothetical protein
VLVSEVGKVLGRRPEKPTPDLRFSYDARPWIKFESEQLQDVFNKIKSAVFTVGYYGINLPKELKEVKIIIGSSSYQIGIGGIHSQEANRKVIGNLIDSDVTSFYPSIILEQNIAPDNMGQAYRSIYKDWFDTRIAHKAAKTEPVLVLALKNFLNGLFGKYGDQYSMVFSPKFLIQTTLTGQLALLMLIEMLESNGISVVSANTDGIVSNIPDDKQDIYKKTVAEWEQITGFNMEFTEYSELYNQSVNSYIALCKNGKVKLKGKFSVAGLKKAPDAEICYKAVIDYLTKGVPTNETITNCRDIRQFLRVTRATSGAYDREQYLGKVIRWYYGKNNNNIFVNGKGNKIARSEGGVLLQILPDNFAVPDDLDYDYYINEARLILRECGVYGNNEIKTGGYTKPGKTTAHYLRANKSKSECCSELLSIRDDWIPIVPGVPVSRICKICEVFL